MAAGSVYEAVVLPTGVAVYCPSSASRWPRSCALSLNGKPKGPPQLDRQGRA